MPPRRKHILRRPAGVLLAVLIPAACTTSADPGPLPASGLAAEVAICCLDRPVHLTAPSGDDRLFVAEQDGRVLVVSGEGAPALFLDISGRVLSGGERGLLSLAFHPDYASNGTFYLNYTGADGGTVVSSFSVSGDPDAADPGSEVIVLRVDQPFPNHNGGHLLFGPDGMLYIALGDGGSAGDPQGNGQDLSTLLGAILRIDVDGPAPYGIPADNPFAAGSGEARPEIWHYGLRNPWRIHIDPSEDLLYVADVGQNEIEEVDVTPASQGGGNLGWRIMEGSQCYAPSSGCQTAGLILPVLEYDHSQGCSITGGAVYRGTALSGLQGHYFYADYCAGWVRSFRYVAGAAIDLREWALGDLGQILSFGTDAHGELYVLSSNGTVYRIIEEDARQDSRITG